MKKKHKEQFMMRREPVHGQLGCCSPVTAHHKKLVFVSICCHVWLFWLFKEVQEVSGHLFWRLSITLEPHCWHTWTTLFLEM